MMGDSPDGDVLPAVSDDGFDLLDDDDDDDDDSSSQAAGDDSCCDDFGDPQSGMLGGAPSFQPPGAVLTSEEDCDPRDRVHIECLRSHVPLDVTQRQRFLALHNSDYHLEYTYKVPLGTRRWLLRGSGTRGLSCRERVLYFLGSRKRDAIHNFEQVCSCCVPSACAQPAELGAVLLLGHQRGCLRDNLPVHAAQAQEKYTEEDMGRMGFPLGVRRHVHKPEVAISKDDEHREAGVERLERLPPNVKEWLLVSTPIGVREQLLRLLGALEAPAVGSADDAALREREQDRDAAERADLAAELEAQRQNLSEAQELLQRESAERAREQAAAAAAHQELSRQVCNCKPASPI
jgi:hypothetical protein